MNSTNSMTVHSKELRNRSSLAYKERVLENSGVRISPIYLENVAANSWKEVVKQEGGCKSALLKLLSSYRTSGLDLGCSYLTTNDPGITGSTRLETAVEIMAEFAGYLNVQIMAEEDKGDNSEPRKISALQAELMAISAERDQLSKSEALLNKALYVYAPLLRAVREARNIQ